MEDGVTTRPVLANAGAMSQFIGAFEVTSKLAGQTYQCRFSHMWNGIATRHADTIDTKFFVDSEAHVIGLAHTAFVKFREKAGRDLTDREASFVAAEYLRERLEEEDARPLYDVAHDDVLRLIGQTGIK
jgi:predicted metal-dependent phosphoesterase TrpH